MSARKKKDEINLLPQKGFESSTSGRILAWILSTFRIIVIVTEIIVMIAFLSRFWFDAQNSDLNEQIQHKQAVLTASQQFEKTFKDVQERLRLFTSLTKTNNLYSSVLTTVTNYLPPDLILTSFVVRQTELEIEGSTSNEKSIEQLLVNLNSTDQLKDVGLTKIATDPDNSSVMIFSVKAIINSSQKGG